MNGVIVSTALVPVSASVGTFTALLPELSDIRKSSKSDPQMVTDIRVAEFTAGALVITIGIACTALVKSPVPVIASVIAVIALVAMYESVLAINPHPIRKVVPNVA